MRRLEKILIGSWLVLTLAGAEIAYKLSDKEENYRNRIFCTIAGCFLGFSAGGFVWAGLSPRFENENHDY